MEPKAKIILVCGHCGRHRTLPGAGSYWCECGTLHVIKADIFVQEHKPWTCHRCGAEIRLGVQHDMSACVEVPHAAAATD